MSLTKKHFIAVGNIFKDEFKSLGRFNGRETGIATRQTALVLDKIADYFQSENPNFNRETFIDYCTTLK